MKKYELLTRDYQDIYENSVNEFNTSSMDKKTKYERFLTRCFVKSFLTFLEAKGLEVRDGAIYVSKEN